MDAELTFQKCSTFVLPFYALLHTIQNEVVQSISFHLAKSITGFCYINHKVKKWGHMHTLLAQKIRQTMQNIPIIYVL